MNKLMTTATALLSLAGAAHAEPNKNRFEFDLQFLRSHYGENYFQCDYTSRRCVDGVRLQDIIVGTVLADDRKTVLGHVMIGGDALFINYDTGEVQMLNKTQTVRDMSANCLNAVQAPWPGSAPCAFSSQNPMILLTKEDQKLFEKQSEDIEKKRREEREHCIPWGSTRERELLARPDAYYHMHHMC